MNDILIAAHVVPFARGVRCPVGVFGGAWFGRKNSLSDYRYGYNRQVSMVKIPQGETAATRIVGLKVGTNTDGGYQVALLSNNGATWGNVGRSKLSIGLTNMNVCTASHDIISGMYSLDMPQLPLSGTSFWPTANVSSIGGNSNGYFYSNNTTGILGSDEQYLDISDIQSLPIGAWSTEGTTSPIETYLSSIGTANPASKSFTINKDTTIKFGVPNNYTTYLNSLNINTVDVASDLLDGDTVDPLIGFKGDVNDYLNEHYTPGLGSASSFVALESPQYNYYNFDANPLSYSTSDYAGTIKYYNLHITSDYDKAMNYLNNGVIPDDDEYDERDPDAPWKEEPGPGPEPEPPDDQIGNNSNDCDDSDTTEYNVDKNTNFGNNLSGINWYYIRYNYLESFINWFWNSAVSDWSAIFFNAITGLYGNLQNCIISIKKINVDPELMIGKRDNTSVIKLGRYSYLPASPANYVQEIKAPIKQLKEVASFSINQGTDLYNFLEYEPYTQYSLYLPYVGIVPIDTSFVKKETFSVRCGVDFMTGEILYAVLMGKSIVGYYQGKCSEEIPFSMESGIQIGSNVVNAAANVGAALSSGGVTAVNSILGQDVSAPTNNNVSVQSVLNKYGGTKVALIKQVPEYYKLYDNSQNLTTGSYGHVAGFKYNCVHRFSLGDGYAEFENPHIDTWNTSPTDAEVDEIYSLMKEGIVL